MTKWTKIILAGIALVILQTICWTTCHTFHIFIWPVQVAVVGWAGFSVRKCIHPKCGECKTEKNDE